MISSMTREIAELCIERLPGRVGATELANARLCWLDGLACAMAAAPLPEIDILWQGCGFTNPRVEAEAATVLGARGTAATESAALVNGMMVSLLLFDDSHSEMRGHPTGPLLPAVLAVGEARGASLGEALTAFVIGYEVECQLGPLFNPSAYEIGWHATATQGTFGATAAAAVLYGLDAEALCRALGIAASLLGGTRRNFGSMTMSLHSGLAASAGVRAANLARLGFTADPAIFDGDMSIGHLLSREWDPARLAQSIQRWGQPFNIVDSGPLIKLSPSGRPTLMPIEASLAIRLQMQAAGVPVSAIRRIVCEVSFMYPRTLIHSAPRTGLQGKTSLQYCVAAALVEGMPGIDTFTDTAVTRPQLIDLASLVVVEVPPDMTEDNPAVRALPFDQPTTMTVEMADGRKFSERVTAHRGMREKPLTLQDLLGKFEACTRGHGTAGRGQQVVDMLHDDQARVADLAALIGNDR